MQQTKKKWSFRPANPSVRFPLLGEPGSAPPMGKDFDPSADTLFDVVFTATTAGFAGCDAGSGLLSSRHHHGLVQRR
jgi:hypothetical protein